MAVASRQEVAPPPGAAPAAAAVERDPEWWVRPLQWLALAVWLAILPFMWFHIHRPWQAHVLWSVIIAGLPLFMLLVGYHRWRKICPLAFFSQIPVMLRRPGTRRASARFEERYYYLMFGFFLFALWLRLLVVNGVGEATALFFILISLAALITGALFTGKTWCNYICPVSLVEKINTEPHGLRETRNSACVKCTACKKSCPDINQENGYWKEIDLPAKRFAYYAYPGLVFAFYFYFYLQGGTWDAYFIGGWVDQPQLFALDRRIFRAFIPDDHPMSFGFYFWPELPRWIASGITLLAGTAVSYGLFSGLEPRLGRWIGRHNPEADAAHVRHIMFTIAAFVGFMTFYAFAGQPLLQLVTVSGVRVPGMLAPGGAIFATIVGTLYIGRRFVRTQKAFAEKTVAQSIVKRWEWTDIRPPEDLHEAFLIHMARSTERKTGYQQILEVYKDAIRETLTQGFLAREDIQRLESLRNQLQIKKADHEKIMASLAEEERALLLDPSKRPSAEKLLQLETYRRALESHLRMMLAADERADDRLVRQLQKEYNVTDEEHAAALDGILGGPAGLADQVTEELHRDEHARHVIQTLRTEPSTVHLALVDLLQRKREAAVDRLLRVLNVDPEDDAGRPIRDGVLADDQAARARAFEALRARVTPMLAERFAKAQAELAAAPHEHMTLVECLRACTESPDPYVRATALYGLAERGAVDLNILRRLADDEHDLVRETLEGLTSRMASKPGGPAPKLTRLEKILALRSVPNFSSIEPESLAELSRSSVEAEFTPGQILVKEGESGEDAFIVLSGSIEVVLKAGTPEEISLAERSVGEIFGEMAVLDPAPRSATLRAGSNGVRVLCLNGAAFSEALRADPAAAHGVIRTLARRLRARLGQIEEERRVS